MEKEYLVEWAINISAESPEEAAKFALEIQRDPKSLATYFIVTDELENKRTEVHVKKGE